MLGTMAAPTVLASSIASESRDASRFPTIQSTSPHCTLDVKSAKVPGM